MSANTHDFQQEPDELAEGSIVGFLVGTVLTMLVGVVVAWVLLVGHEAEYRPSGNFLEKNYGSPLTQERRNEKGGATEPGIELVPFSSKILPAEEDRKKDTKALHSYGWADAEKKTIHIPIEKAMEMVVKGQAQ